MEDKLTNFYNDLGEVNERAAPQIYAKPMSVAQRYTEARSSIVEPKRKQRPMSYVGTFKYTMLKRDHVIKSADSSKYDQNVLRDSQFIFNDNGKGGFIVDFIFKEPAKLNM